MKNRIKGLLSIIMVICITLSVGITAFANDTIDFFSITDDSVLYSGTKIVTDGKSGNYFIVVDEDGNILNTSRAGFNSSNVYVNYDEVNQTQDVMINNIVANDSQHSDGYVLPKNTEGYYGYTADYNRSKSTPADILKSIKLYDGTTPVDMSHVNNLMATEGSQFYDLGIVVIKERPIDYVLSLDGNGGTVATTSKDMKTGEADKLSETPTRAGYEFSGWNTKADGTGVKVAKDATASDLSKVMTNLTYDATVVAEAKTTPVKLYAQWVKVIDKTATSEVNDESKTQKNEIADTVDNNMVAVPMTLALIGAFAVVSIDKKRRSL